MLTQVEASEQLPPLSAAQAMPTSLLDQSPVRSSVQSSIPLLAAVMGQCTACSRSELATLSPRPSMSPPASTDVQLQPADAFSSAASCAAAVLLSLVPDSLQQLLCVEQTMLSAVQKRTQSLFSWQLSSGAFQSSLAAQETAWVALPFSAQRPTTDGRHRSSRTRCACASPLCSTWTSPASSRPLTLHRSPLARPCPEQ